MEWKYLYSESFKVRQVIAAHYLKECTEVVEIGGYRCPVGDFLPDEQPVIMLDPKCVPLTTEKRCYMNIRFQDWQWTMKDGFGLVILGLELHLSDADQWHNLFSLANRSKIFVLGWPSDFPTSQKQVKRILENMTKQKIFHVQLDLSLAPMPDMTDSAPPYFKRELVVFA